ncbi:UNVERIFIED_CONTAM: hypothetical protein GTU68_033683 [Idotea baltica]|nr:hypothetical protein [Idotea baltica]
MSGHSKWSKIKRKKGANDQKRGKIFSRIVKEITVSVKEGGSVDPDFNPRLRLAIQNAKGVNMPKDNISRAIKKADEAGGANFVELNYEGYAPGGIAIYVECLSDNQNRTVANVRALFSKNNGSLATSGSVAFMFDRKAMFEFKASPEFDLDEFTLEVIDAGAEDVDWDQEENIVSISANISDFGNMAKKLEDLKIEISSAKLERIPQNTTKVDDDVAREALRLIDKIEDDDDVQAVFHNLELSDALLAEME